MTAVTDKPAELDREGPAHAAGTSAERKQWMPPALRRWAGTRGPRGPRPPVTPTSVAVAWTAGALSLLAAWFVFYAVVLSSLAHNHDQSVLYSQLRQELALATAPLGGQIDPGSPVGLIDMPSAGIHEVVVEGTASGDLMKGPGHRRDTPMPGQAGVSLIYGPASLFGGPFGDIAGAKPGDSIKITNALGEADYVVQDVRHAGDPFPQPLASGAGRLTLVTAQSSGWRSGWAPDGVVYVDAALKSKPVAGVSGRPVAVPKSETAMQGDRGALQVLVLVVPLLLFAVLAIAWAQLRWGRWQTWIVGAPVLLGALWLVSQTAVRLLPNLS